MNIPRAKLRAFPRLAAATPATFRIGDVQQLGQLLDLSRGGFKALPSQLEVLVERNFLPGTDLLAEVNGIRLPARIMWATPNFSALGCAFHDAISSSLLDRLTAAESHQPHRPNTSAHDRTEGAELVGAP